MVAKGYAHSNIPLLRRFGVSLFLYQRPLRRATGNQSPRDRAARDSIGVHSVPQPADESVNAFCLHRLRLGR
jgi:hypothetical protein